MPEPAEEPRAEPVEAPTRAWPPEGTRAEPVEAPTRARPPEGTRAEPVEAPTRARPQEGTRAEPVEAPTRARPPEGTRAEPVEAHDPTGLNLARTIANAVGANRIRRKRPRREPRPEPKSTGAHPDDRDPQLLGAAMDRLVDSQGWSREISVHLLLGKWPSLVGPDNAAHSTPVGYADTVLTVRATSTAWATQLRMMAPRIVAKLNEALGEGTVTRVNILGPDAPSWKHGRRSVRDGRGPRDTYG